LVDEIMSESEKGQILYWAAVGGSASVVNKLVDVKKDLKDWFTRKKAGPKAVQAAASNGHREVAQKLIQTLMECDKTAYQREPTVVNESAWKTPLHWAVHYKSKDSDSIVRNLLMTGTGADRQLSMDFIQRLEAIKDDFFEGRSSDIIEMLKTPLRFKRKPTKLETPKIQSDSVMAACKLFHTSIIDIYTWKSQSCTIERIGDVGEILYTLDSGPQQVMENARKAWNLHSIGLEHRFRWIHLPANNVSGHLILF
jgi:hypothetical protein